MIQRKALHHLVIIDSISQLIKFIFLLPLETTENTKIGGKRVYKKLILIKFHKKIVMSKRPKKQPKNKARGCGLLQQQRQHEDSGEVQYENFSQQQIDFNSSQSWPEMDNLELQLFNGGDVNHSDSSECSRLQKRDKRREREEQIEEYAEALKLQQAKNLPFMNPFQPYQLNVNKEQYQRMIVGVKEGTILVQGVARMLGLKSLRILHQEKLSEVFDMIAGFLVKLEVPTDIVEKYQYLLKSQGDNLYKPVKNEESVSPIESTQQKEKQNNLHGESKKQN